MAAPARTKQARGWRNHDKRRPGDGAGSGAGRDAQWGRRRQWRRPRRPAGTAPVRWRLHHVEEKMPPLRSRTVTHGRNMAGARALLRATGVAREDIGKPIVAVANSF